MIQRGVAGWQADGHIFTRERKCEPSVYSLVGLLKYAGGVRPLSEPFASIKRRFCDGFQV